MVKIIKTFVGRQKKEGEPDKGDVLIWIEKSDQLVVKIESSVGKLFQKQQKKIIFDILNKKEISARVKIIDNGAFDYTIKARLKAAIALAKNEELKIDIDSSKILKKISPELKKSKGSLRRTRLYIPGNNPNMMQNAYLFGADALIFDLEDSVAMTEKVPARYLVKEAIEFLPLKNIEIMVRINSLDTLCKEDLNIVLKSAKVNSILVPKCESKEDIIKVDSMLTYFEGKYNIKSVGIIPLIETAKGVLNANEIAKASLRNVAISFGAEDFTADIGVKRSSEGKELYYAKSKVILAAKANSIQALDTVYSDVANVHGLKEDTEESKGLGFDGRGIIHPNQIDIVHRVYAPTQEDLEYALKVVEVLDKARERGDGVASLEKKMIDLPVELRARKIIKLAEKIKNNN